MFSIAFYQNVWYHIQGLIYPKGVCFIMKEKNFKLTRIACFTAYIAAASAFALPPLLFVTFREMYGISYTLLGTLILINFCTQLAIDLIFTFFTRYFSITQKENKIKSPKTEKADRVWLFWRKIHPKSASFLNKRKKMRKNGQEYRNISVNPA